MQSFRLTLYAGVYRHLGGTGGAVEPGPVPSSDDVAPAPILVAAPQIRKRETRYAPGLAEITVPDEVAGPVETPVEVTVPHV